MLVQIQLIILWWRESVTEDEVGVNDIESHNYNQLLYKLVRERSSAELDIEQWHVDKQLHSIQKAPQLLQRARSEILHDGVHNCDCSRALTKCVNVFESSLCVLRVRHLIWHNFSHDWFRIIPHGLKVTEKCIHFYILR